jgi:adenylate kinase
LTKRLEEFRKANTDEITMLNFFDELDINPITLQVEVNDSNKLLALIYKNIGEPRNYGKTHEELAEDFRQAESQRVLNSSLIVAGI